MLTVIQYYIIKIKKTKTSRKDLKKGKNMMNQKKDYNMITKKLETELSSFHFDGLEISEITTSTSWMVLHINVLFIKDNVQITKVLYKDYQTGLWYYIKDKGMVISHKDTYNHTIKNLIDEMIYDVHFEIKEPEETAEKHYYDYTSEDFIKAGIAKECTTCPDFCEEDCIENAECSRGNDVFDGCKTVKDVMEVKQELNARFGKEQYFDTDSLQSNKTISAKIENINHCPNQNTCCIVSPFVNCDYNYKSEECIKAHKNFNHYCEQVHKQLKAKHKPEWHHISLDKLANIDFDMLDEKRKLVRNINQILKDGIRNLYKCENHIAFEALERDVIRKCNELIRRNHLKAFWFSYIAQQLDEVRRNTIYLYTPYITIHRNRW